MPWPLYLLYGFFGVILQSTLVASLIPTPGRPDLLLLLVVHLALHESVVRGTTLCWGLGLLYDAMAGYYLGLHSLVYILVFLSLKSFVQRLNADSTLLLLSLVALGSLLQAGFLFFFTGLFSPSRFLLSFQLNEFFWQLGWSVVFGHLLGMLFFLLQHRFGPSRWLPPTHRLENVDED